MNQKDCIKVKSNPYVDAAFLLFYGFDAYRRYISDDIHIGTILFYIAIGYWLIDNYIRPRAIITKNKIKILKAGWFRPRRTYSYTPEQIVITNKSFLLRGEKLFSTFWTNIKPKELREFCLQTQTEEVHWSKVK